MADIKKGVRWRRGDRARWTELEIVLEAGEPGLEKDTGHFKVGDGVTSWCDLPYFLNEDGVAALITDRLNDLGADDLDPRIGDLNELTTTKTSLVAAINELDLSSISLSSLYANAKAG